jgi:hypothetical protein
VHIISRVAGEMLSVSDGVEQAGNA